MMQKTVKLKLRFIVCKYRIAFYR